MSQELKSKAGQIFGWNLASALKRGNGESAAAELLFCGDNQAAQAALEKLGGLLPAWVRSTVKWDEGELWVLPCSDKPRILVRPKNLTEAQLRDAGLLAPSPYSQARDLVGRALGELKRLKVSSVALSFHGAPAEAMVGALVGWDVAAYTYKSALSPEQNPSPSLEVVVPEATLSRAAALAGGINLARHLVNTPPNVLYPEAFASVIMQAFSGFAGLSASLWDAERLKRERMGLHLAVGNASENKPCLLHLRYRPQTGSQEAPLALIGKGITFDSGGLDIKDPAGMRLMKKDMGGAAAIIGALYAYLTCAGKRPLDIYLPLAENAISGQAYRPGDVITARSGMRVEIHNTDAEGRLVLADALSVAGSQEGADKPQALIVVATLTGAIKVGLGSDIAGMFVNDERLAQLMQRKSQEFGDYMWRMPLFEGYRAKLETPQADINHCATGSFGGAITAALFLAEFAKGYPFAHLDIYAWADAERGALREPGGSGQAVQALFGMLEAP